MTPCHPEKSLLSKERQKAQGYGAREAWGQSQPVAFLPLTSLRWFVRVEGGQPVTRMRRVAFSGARAGVWAPPHPPGRGSFPLALTPQHRRQQMLLVSLHFNRFTSMPLCVTEKLGVNPILRTQWNSLLEEHVGKSFWEVNNNRPLVELLCQYARISLSEMRFTWKAFPVISSLHFVTVFFPMGHTLFPLPVRAVPPSLVLSPHPLGLSPHAP